MLKFFGKNSSNSEFVDKLKSKLRLVIMNSETFEEQFSVSLTPLNVFIWVGVSAILLVFLIFSLIAFTSLREYIPGYADVELKKNAMYAALKADSLQDVVSAQQLYIQNINAVIDGKPIQRRDSTQSVSAQVDLEALDENDVQSDSMLKKMVEIEDQYNIPVGQNIEENLSNIYFYPPLQGTISNRYNSDQKHFGVDILAAKNEAIKSTMDGTVIFASWTPETGHVIQLQHAFNLVSVYKHNSRLLKKEGDIVKAGEVIAIIGNTGEFSTGPHLHFEIWHKSAPVNPEKFVVF